MIIMLASDICRLVMRQQPVGLLQQLQEWTVGNREIVVSAITYAELIAASLLTADQQRHMALVDAFCARLDAIVPWDAGAVDSYTTLQRSIMRGQRSLNMNDVMIAAHAISLDAMLLSSNDKVFGSMPGLEFRQWGKGQDA
ncbi:MAG: type II toxin-antitoxin system VapC family toxin [Pseudohongiellaceae bacterium]|jgi:tRNA(fMet)-specific endonuclease VapC